jgi:hypothetical protein
VLGVARARQYGTFLGNPDPTGCNVATYLYRSATPPAPVAAPVARAASGGPWRTLLVVAALLAALALGAVAWARS